MVTTKFSDLAIRTYSSLWYKYPHSVQPYVIFLMARAQDDFYFRGFKWSRCTLESFTNVSKFSTILHFNQKALLLLMTDSSFFADYK